MLNVGTCGLAKTLAPQPWLAQQLGGGWRRAL